MVRAAGLLVVALLVIPASRSPVMAGEPAYYILAHGKLQPAYDDPGRLMVKDWQIWLYRNGEPKGGQDYWGSITGKSAADVQRTLESRQDFQVRYARWAGFDYRTERLTYFNALGPIARLKSLQDPLPTSKMIEAGQHLAKTYDAVREGYNKIRLVLFDRAKPPNPYGDVGKVLKGYVKGLEDGVAKVSDLRKRMESGSDAAQHWLSELDQVDDDLVAQDRELDTISDVASAEPGQSAGAADGAVENASGCITVTAASSGKILHNECAKTIVLRYGTPGQAWTSYDLLQAGEDMETFNPDEVRFAACPQPSKAMIWKDGRFILWTPLHEDYLCIEQ